MPEITYALPRIVDGGLPPHFVDDVRASAAEEGFHLKEYAIWFDMRRGPEGAWMVTFKMEPAHAHSS